MRTSLTETEQAEKFLLKEMDPADALLFEAKMLCNPALKAKVLFQQKLYAAVRMYHRKKLKEEAALVHHRLFSDPEKAAFREKVFQLFKK